MSARRSFRVRPGERVATDGEVVEGGSAVGLSLATGESEPVDHARAHADADTELPDVVEFRARPGRGVRGVVDGRPVEIGAPVGELSAVFADGLTS